MASGLSQETKEKESTKVGSFSSKSGTLIERQFLDVGKVKGLEVKVIKLKDLISNASLSALRFEYSTSYSGGTKINQLDGDEVEGLVKSMQKLVNDVFISSVDVYTEITFQSKSGFEAGAYFDTSKKVWKPYLKIEKYDSKSNVFLELEDFSKLLELIKQAQTIL